VPGWGQAARGATSRREDPLGLRNPARFQQRIPFGRGSRRLRGLCHRAWQGPLHQQAGDDGIPRFSQKALFSLSMFHRDLPGVRKPVEKEDRGDSGGDPRGPNCPTRRHYPILAYSGTRGAVWDTSSHFPLRFSKTSVSAVGAFMAAPAFDLPTAFAMPIDHATSPFT
jgi:hypothetical protein